LGMILSEQGELDSARRHLEEVVRLLPDFAEARRQLSMILERQR
ncbi:MAG: tetratricopeptide repeat protein, partial [bacterium]|nr:tetratricopeptide repeat protein [bacterium]